MKEQLKQAIKDLFPKSDDTACNKRMSYRRNGANTVLSTPSILRHADPEIMKQAGWESSEWISVEDRLPTEKDADENGKVLIWREVNDGQKSLSKSIFDWWMVIKCDKSSYWKPLPQPPKQ